MKSELSTICSFRKEKIAVSTLSLDNYVSTENMVQDRGGIVRATSLPAVSITQAYKKDDVLVSNIRPYFKKIWKATCDGGCSNDVLVFTAINNCNSNFLYYILSDDNFFDYATATAKGTKMPRGDKKAIMEYQVPPISTSLQEKIGSILLSIDAKILNNRKVNDNLEQQAQSIYREHIESVKSNDLPSDWRVVQLDEIAIISNKSFNPLKESERILEHYSIPAFDETKFPVFELSTSIKSNKFIVDSSCLMISKLNPTIKRVWRPYCLTRNAVCSTEFIVYKAKDTSITDFLYSVIDSKSFSDFMCSHVTGSTGSRQRTTPSDTLSYEVILPSKDDLVKFQSLVSPMYSQIRNNAIENYKLKQLRNSLLPKLISGEFDVSNIKL